ncbi:MAG: hypothetical protein ACI4U2_04675 [Christensenellaceae bacterium]
MKKNCLTMSLAALLGASLLIGCSTAPSIERPASVKLCLPDGTPMIAVTNLLAEGLEIDGETVSIETQILPASEIATAFTPAHGASLAIMPTVSAATIYAKGQDVNLLSANVFGNLYVVGVGEAASLSDLVGKVVYTTAGTTIALLEYELAANDIAFEMGSSAQEGCVTLYSMDAASDYLPLIKQAQVKGGEAYGVLGEPAVTKCMSAVATESKIVVDLQAEYEAITGEAGYPQAGLVGSGEFVRAYPEFIDALLAKLALNGAYLDGHTAELKEFYTSLGSTTLNGIDYTAETIDRCNLSLLKGEALASAVTKYIAGLGEYVPSLRDIDLSGFVYGA